MIKLEDNVFDLSREIASVQAQTNTKFFAEKISIKAQIINM